MSIVPLISRYPPSIFQNWECPLHINKTGILCNIRCVFYLILWCSEKCNIDQSETLWLIQNMLSFHAHWKLRNSSKSRCWQTLSPWIKSTSRVPRLYGCASQFTVTHIIKQLPSSQLDKNTIGALYRKRLIGYFIKWGFWRNLSGPGIMSYLDTQPHKPRHNGDVFLSESGK